MGVQIAKKPAAVAAPAKPFVGTPPAKPAPVAPVAPVETTADAEAQEEAEEAAVAKEPKKKRADFATHEDFCDYKIGLAEEALVRATKKVQLWKDKKANKDADVLVKKEKKADKLFE